MSSPYPISDQLRERLRGLPEQTMQDCAEFKATGNQAALDRAVFDLIEYHLSAKPPKPLSTYPGTTALVAELQLDSLTMIELVFIFEDLFDAKLPQEELIAVVTIDDLRSLLRRHLPAIKAE
jgi:acyl carrier protein